MWKKKLVTTKNPDLNYPQNEPKISARIWQNVIYIFISYTCKKKLISSQKIITKLISLGAMK